MYVPPNPPRNRYWLDQFLASTILITAGLGLSELLEPVLEPYRLTRMLEERLESLTLLQAVRGCDGTDDWDESRLISRSSESGERLVSVLTSLVTRVPGKIALDPLVRTKKDRSESVMIAYLGRELGGKDALVRGATLAHIMDKEMERMVSDYHSIVTLLRQVPTRRQSAIYRTILECGL